MSAPLREQVRLWCEDLRDRLCGEFEAVDGAATFSREPWSRDGGGGGLSRTIRNGAVFEKGGVNTSTVFGHLPGSAAAAHPARDPSFATGISLVLHPQNPMVPAMHANFRYFEAGGGDAWFGGGCDLTPAYLFEEDVRHFHAVLCGACERAEPGSYTPFKIWCDDYFHIGHRGERRGVGGVFFDELRGDAERRFAFVRSVGDALVEAYIPIVRRRRNEPFGDAERAWQLLRRGRYAEFNLVLDRGTAFGLQTGARTASVLMSLPPLARWDEAWTPEPGSREAAMLEVLRTPRDWAAPPKSAAEAKERTHDH